MTFKKFSRAGLLALVLGLLLGAVLSASTFTHPSFAQDAAAAPAQADAGPPACSAAVAAVDDPDPAKKKPAVPAVVKDCTFNSGDTAWMLTSMALVLMMTIPGLGLFYGGMVRRKNVGDTIMTSFAITCLISILWLSIHRRIRPRLPAGDRR
jgi:Amt family ammonium transporter